MNREFEIPETPLAERLARLLSAKPGLLPKQPSAVPPCGYDAVAAALRECGTTHIYGVAGRPTEEILPACFRQGIRPIGVYHQTAAVCMALAQNYQTGRLVATALVSAGPAATNALTGLLVARDNGWPVIVLGGRRSSFQALDVVPIVRPVTKHAVSVASTSAIGACIHEACEIAMSGRPGPVYLDLHEEALAGNAATAPVSSARSTTPNQRIPSVSDDGINRVVAALLEARRPALLLGKGVRWTVPPALLRELVDGLDLPFITSPMGRGFLPDDHPLCFNRARTVLQSHADVVLVLGARLNWVFRYGAELSRDARVLRVDIHRETQDDGFVQTEFLHADAGDFVTRLVSRLKSRSNELSDASRRQRLSEWHTLLRTVSDEIQRSLDHRMNSDGRPMSPYRMMKEVRDALPGDAICVTEGNISMLAAQAVIPACRPASRMDAGTNGCMGIAIPFAIGAKIACPGRPVVVVVGDYGFSLSAMEMEVCVRHKIPIVVVIANNQGNNGAIKQRSLFLSAGSERVTMFQPMLEYDRIMAMFGGQGATVADPDQLKPALERALSAGTPVCINVVIDPEMPPPHGWGVRAVERQ